MGMNEEILNRIVEYFVQADDSTTGKLSQAVGCDATVESQSEVGRLFSLIIAASEREILSQRCRQRTSRLGHINPSFATLGWRLVRRL